MKTDTLGISAVWGRIGAAVLLLVSVLVQQFGGTFDAGTQQQVYSAIDKFIIAANPIIAMLMALRSKVWEIRRKKIAKDADAGGAKNPGPTAGLVSMLFMALISLVFMACAAWVGGMPSICSDAARQASLRAWVIENYSDNDALAEWARSGDENSLLCAIAEHNDLHLDYAGDLVFTGDLLAIRSKTQTNQEAIAMFARAKEFTLANQARMTASSFSVLAYQLLGDYPEVNLAAAPLLAQIKLSGPALFYPKDIAMLMWYFDRNLEVLRGI